MSADRSPLPAEVMSSLSDVWSMIESINQLAERLIGDGLESPVNAILEAMQACAEKADRAMTSVMERVQEGDAS